MDFSLVGARSILRKDSQCLKWLDKPKLTYTGKVLSSVDRKRTLYIRNHYKKIKTKIKYTFLNILKLAN